ncbi:MAG: hypothetical protein GEV10_02725 [Streptosporangiales bacterium]|nr:hypothetical protein [Streptosporangiales bacterium]
MTAQLQPYRTPGPPPVDGAQQHRDWLDLVEVTGPFLSLPVLRSAWPGLDPLDKAVRDRLRLEHGDWLNDQATKQRAWIEYLLCELLGWGADVLFRDETETLAALSHESAEHAVTVLPDFAVVEPGEDVKPATTRLVGLICPPASHPTAANTGAGRTDDWPASPADRLVQLCRHHGVPLGLATGGRFWTLVWAPRATERRPAVTTTATFDAVSWPESAERNVVRAFVSMLCRTRFFSVPDDETLPALLEASLGSQEEITEALGVQVRQAVELLMAAIGRADLRAQERGEPGLRGIDAHDVYRGAVSTMMRVVFLLFAEDRGLLPSDNDLYAGAYSASGLYARLHSRAVEGSEDDLEHSTAAWHRLLALFRAVHDGVDHPRLRMHAHDGPIFDPESYDWLPRAIDDRTVLHMMRAVQHVEIGRGRSRELRTVGFGALDVEEIGYVYEGLLSFEGYRAEELIVGLVGAPGHEAEVALTELERLAAAHPGVPALAAALAERYKDAKIGSAKALEKRLAPLGEQDREEARRLLLAVTGGDYPLAERMLPFHGLIRHDLRGQPLVIPSGALYVTESPLRKNSGTHYTPRPLAEEVVEHALQPLVYSPGPLQTADESQWVLRPSTEILALKVADIAMGSAAFLVAAARYLGDKLVMAWSRQGVAPAQSRVVAGDKRRDAEEDPVVVEARRKVIEHCLYGVDINPMAVEMAKLSLWLVSMDGRRPFTFLDDRLVAGDSLLGITSLEQLEYMHLDPAKGRELHETDLLGWTSGVRSLVADVAEHRRQIGEIELGDDPMAALDRKRELLAEARKKAEPLRLFADLTVGAALAGHAKRTGSREPNARADIDAERGTKRADLSHRAAELADLVNRDVRAWEAREHADTWLATDQVPGSFAREPLHWPLVFPEVFAQDGFDAVIGNPPFLGGQKLTRSLGTAYREHLVLALAAETRGSADLVAYFALRAHELLNPSGQTGLLATNTLAQGDTRETGLDQLVANGAAIRRAIKSRPWPSRSAVLEYCAVWTSGVELDKAAVRIADDAVVKQITPSLEAGSRVVGSPNRLVSNAERSFQGSNVLGLGFTMTPDEAAALVEKDPRNKEVLFPYLNGQDLNSRPDCSGSRLVINFRDWPEERAKGYPDCYDRVIRLVKPERAENRYSKSARQRWWLYERARPELYGAIDALEKVVVITLVSRTVTPVIVPTGQVFSHMLGVFATDDTAMLAMLSSAPHYWWAVARASSMKADLRYTPSDVFETFPLPELTQGMRELGDRLDTFRREVMLGRDLGLTKTYNLVFDPGCTDPDIVEMRQIHRAIDVATVRAYGWDDLVEQLDHGFHPAGRDLRYTVGPAAKQEILDRLLELNHERYAAEVAAGLHDKKKPKQKRATPQASEGQDGLF